MKRKETVIRDINADELKALEVHVLQALYEKMLLIRVTEERIADLVETGNIKTPCHLYIGQEAIAAGVCQHLTEKDFVYSTHRSHGHYLAKNGDLNAMMAEIFGKATGCSKGHGGSMHLVSKEHGLPGSSAMVAGTIALAVGSALSFAMDKSDRVAVAFFGDGAANEGVLYEAMNFASLYQLPVIFVCENNFYSTHMPIGKMHAQTNLYEKARAFDMPSYCVDGTNVVDVYQVAEKAIVSARNQSGPVFIECLTYRWRGHVGPKWDLNTNIRAKEEVDWWVEQCCLQKLERVMMSTGRLTEETKNNCFESVHTKVEAAVAFANESPLPDRATYKSMLFNTEAQEDKD